MVQSKRRFRILGAPESAQCPKPVLGSGEMLQWTVASVSLLEGMGRGEDSSAHPSC